MNVNESLLISSRFREVEMFGLAVSAALLHIVLLRVCELVEALFAQG